MTIDISEFDGSDFRRRITYVFGEENADAVIRYIVSKDHHSEDFFLGIDSKRLDRVKRVFEDIGMDKLGNKQVKAAVNLARLVTAYDWYGIGIDVDFGSYGSVKNAYDAVKNIYDSRFMDSKSEHEESRYTIGSGAYVIVFEQGEKVLQGMAVEKIRSCFSIKGVKSHTFEAYSESDNIFFPVIFDVKNNEIVGRFTLAIGHSVDGSQSPQETISSPDSVSIARISKVHVDFGHNLNIDRSEVDAAVRTYAGGKGMKMHERGEFLIRVPRTVERSAEYLYDDYIAAPNAMQLNRDMYDERNNPRCVYINNQKYERLVLKSPIMFAVETDDLAEFRRIVSKERYDPNEKDAYGVALVRKILFVEEAKAGPIDRERKAVEMFNLLLENPELDLGVKNAHMESILHTMIITGKDALFDAFLDNPRFVPDMLTERDSQGRWSLTLAIESRRVHMVERILQSMESVENISEIIDFAKFKFREAHLPSLKGAARLLVDGNVVESTKRDNSMKSLDILKMLNDYAASRQDSMKLLRVC